MNKTFKIIAGILSAILCLLEVYMFIYFLGFGAMFISVARYLCYGLAFLLLSLGCFLDKKVLRIIATGVGVLIALILIIRRGPNVIEQLEVTEILYKRLYTVFYLVEFIIEIIYWALLLIMNIIKPSKSSLLLGIIASSLQLLFVIYRIFVSSLRLYRYSWLVWVIDIICILLPVALGIFLKSNGDKEMVKDITKDILMNEEVKTASADKKITVEAKSDKAIAKKILSDKEMIEELKKLKDLLDAGVINEDELNQLKKDILHGQQD